MNLLVRIPSFQLLRSRQRPPSGTFEPVTCLWQPDLLAGTLERKKGREVRRIWACWLGFSGWLGAWQFCPSSDPR